MAYDRTTAQKLLTASEFELFDDSRRDRIGTLDERGLKSRVTRTRRLRDKYRDLAQRQRLATRARTGSKRGAHGDANRRTMQKRELFSDVLERFEDNLRSRQRRSKNVSASAKSSSKAGAARRQSGNGKPQGGRTASDGKKSGTKGSAAKAPGAKASAAATGPAKTGKVPAAQLHTRTGPANPQTGFMSTRAKALDTKRQMQKSHGSAIQAHSSSRGRRNQAKRDSR